MKYQTLPISLAKQKQSDINNSYHDNFIIVHCLPKLLLLKLSRSSYNQDLIYVDRALDTFDTLDLFLFTLKEKNFARRKFRGRKLSRFCVKTFLLNFSKIVISELSAQKERFHE